MKIYIALLTIICLQTSGLMAQIDLEKRLKDKVNQRIDRKVDQGIDKTLDKTEEEAKKAAKGEGKNDKDRGSNSSGESRTESGTGGQTTGSTDNSKGQGTSLKTYGKFDFVPGERVLILEDFSQVNLGDFPADWNTNSGGEIVSVDNEPGKWLMLSKEGVFLPEYITDLPENFTLQFDLHCNTGFSYYSTAFLTSFLATSNRSRLNEFGKYSHPAHAVRLSLHPEDAGGQQGSTGFINWDAQGVEIMHNDVATLQFHEGTHSSVKVSIWRQKQRMRVYLNEEKVLDIPRAFDATVKYNTLAFTNGSFHSTEDRYVISNLRLAIGTPDTRSKLITEGRLITRGILFDSNSDKIRGESFGTLKEIASVLQENPTVKVRIIGHTDSEGEDVHNLDLSRRRSSAVKEALSREFNIESSRMETDGKGESEPADKNDSPVGRANNRRVEFVKL